MRTHYSQVETTAASQEFAPDVCDAITSAASAQNGSPVLPPLLATGAFALILMAGTGGGVAGQTLSGLGQLSNPTSVEYRLVGRLNRPDEPLVEEATPTVLTRIRAYFGLNMTEFASVSRVSRPAVYAWLRGETQPQDVHAERIRCLAKIVRHAARVTPQPVRQYLHRELSSGLSLYQMLLREQIEEGEVRTALAEISEAMASARGTASSRTTAVELAQRFGYARPPVSFADELFGEEAD
jgi:hypothetical protein